MAANYQHKASNCAPPPIGLKQAQVVVVMVPFPAQGHLNQLLHLSRLILSYNIPVHFVGAAIHNSQAKVRLHGWDLNMAANIHFHDIQVPPMHCPSPDPNAKNKFPSHLQPSFNIACPSHLREPVSLLLRELSCKARKVVIIHDSLMRSVIQEARLFSNAVAYTFHSVSAFTIYLFKKEQVKGNPLEPIDVIPQEVPSGSGVIPEEVPSLDGCFATEFLEFISSQYVNEDFNSGYLYNTCRLIEGTYVELLEKERRETPTEHWALGPFNPVTIPEKKKAFKPRHYCLEWLDKQEGHSVIYVSFGTTTALKDEQIRELAKGLKQSHQKFIWVVREADRGDVFSGENSEESARIPKEFEDSTAGMGLVVTDWAPQLEILAHPATGGFMSHCGWNSCVESITMGVPIAAWPMHSDQPRNTVLITKLLKIGIDVRDWSRRDEIVAAQTVATAVKRLINSAEGDEVRKRAAEMGEAVRRSMAEGGASRKEFDSFIAHITR